MTWFAIIAGVFAVAAVILLVLPLLRPGRRATDSARAANVSIYRDQFAELERDLEGGTLTADQYGQARAELERRLLEDVDAAQPSAASAPRSGRWTVLAVGIAVPVCAGLLYLHLGNPQGLQAPKPVMADASNITVEQFQQMTEKLAARLQEHPNDPVGWMMLGRAYKALERYPEAVSALQRAEKLEPRNPEILVDYAEAIALARSGNLQGPPSKLLQRALEIAPEHEKALTLAGTAAFGRNDYAGAIRYWQRLASKVPADSELGRALSTGIAEAQARAGGKVPETQAARPAPDASKGVSGVVQLAPALAAKAAPDDTVYVFARAAEGPKMPLAVLKKQVKDLPLVFKLDDSMAMSPGVVLSSFPRVIVAARISKSGSAIAKAGDLEGASAPVNPGSDGVNVVIDSQVR